MATQMTVHPDTPDWFRVYLEDYESFKEQNHEDHRTLDGLVTDLSTSVEKIEQAVHTH